VLGVVCAGTTAAASVALLTLDQPVSTVTPQALPPLDAGPQPGVPLDVKPIIPVTPATPGAPGVLGVLPGVAAPGAPGVLGTGPAAALVGVTRPDPVTSYAPANPVTLVGVPPAAGPGAVDPGPVRPGTPDPGTPDPGTPDGHPRRGNRRGCRPDDGPDHRADPCSAGAAAPWHGAATAAPAAAGHGAARPAVLLHAARAAEGPRAPQAQPAADAPHAGTRSHRRRGRGRRTGDADDDAGSVRPRSVAVLHCPDRQSQLSCDRFTDDQGRRAPARRLDR
jgi:hypothetical protein